MSPPPWARSCGMTAFETWYTPQKFVLFGAAGRGDDPITRFERRLDEGAAEAARGTGDEPCLPCCLHAT